MLQVDISTEMASALLVAEAAYFAVGITPSQCVFCRLQIHRYLSATPSLERRLIG
jgi:hypothetical protein